MNHILEADSIKKDFGKKRILSDVYLKCSTGELVGLLGRNGCGKSTLLKILFGTLETPYKTIRIDGKNCSYPYRKSGLISYLPQEPIFPINISIYKTLKTVLRSEQLFEMMNIDRVVENVHRAPTKISGGERKFIEVCFIIALKSKFILLDEPFTGIEPIYREVIAEKLKECRKDFGIIVSDHDYRNVLATTQRQYYLNDATLWEIDGIEDLQKFGYIGK